MKTEPGAPVKFRESETELLAAYITGCSATSAANVIVSGYKSVGKTLTVLKHLNSLGVRKTVINCDEFITQKILLQKCLHDIRIDSGVDLQVYRQRFMYKGLEAARISLLCETFSHFLMALEQFFQESQYLEHHVLVLDRFDQCIDTTDELFASFLRFREYSSISNLSIVYITSHDDPREITSFFVPHVYFRPYSQEETTQILVQTPAPEVLSGEFEFAFWSKFAKLTVDLYFDYTGSDLTLLLVISAKTWPKVVALVRAGEYSQRQFLNIYRELRDELLADDVISNNVISEYGTTSNEKKHEVAPLSDLPYHSKFILIASYLASFTDHKADIQLFSKMKSVRKSPKKTSSNKENVDSRLLSASFFDLERLKAILSVIYRNESSTLSRDSSENLNLYHELTERDIAKRDNEYETFTLNKNVDVNTQISTLVSLGLLSRTYAMDMLSARIRWKCEVSWDLINAIANDINFPLHNYSSDV